MPDRSTYSIPSYYCITGKFCRGPIFADGQYLPFCGFNFRGHAHSHAHEVLYN